jgi:hypothetical protein
MQNEEQRELITHMYDEFDDPHIPKFHYGSHFSTMGFVLYYLMRVEPFTAYHKALQSGRFDHADRLFHSLERTYHSCTHASSDVKELVPGTLTSRTPPRTHPPRTHPPHACLHTYASTHAPPSYRLFAVVFAAE